MRQTNFEIAARVAAGEGSDEDREEQDEELVKMAHVGNRYLKINAVERVKEDTGCVGEMGGWESGRGRQVTGIFIATGKEVGVFVSALGRSSFVVLSLSHTDAPVGDQ